MDSTVYAMIIAVARARHPPGVLGHLEH